MHANNHETLQTDIGEYAIVGDCRIAELISKSGSIDWLCFPNFSSPSIFARILDPDGGHFSINPCGNFTTERRYRDNTPILETIFQSDKGEIKLTDVVPVIDGIATMQPMRELLRIVDCIGGQAELYIEIRPRPNYSCIAPIPQYHRNIGWFYKWNNEVLVIGSNIEFQWNGTALHAFIKISVGERRSISLYYTQGDIAIIPPQNQKVQERLMQTVEWWQGWSERCTYQGSHKTIVMRSALTLKLLTHCISGSLLAAATTSLPEAIGHDRNWDYRYCWLRDAGLAVQALVGLGFIDDARTYLSWLLHTTRLTWPELNIAYDIYGRRHLAEKEAPQFKGYKNSKPVRIGNAAYMQRQMDVYGQVILAAYTLACAGHVLDPVEATMIIGFGNTVCEQWHKADSGMWEIRGPRRQYTMSKVMCWVALDRLVKLHENGEINLKSNFARFHVVRDLIHKTIENKAFNGDIGCYTSELNGTHLNSSLLLMGCLYKSASESRIVATYERIHEKLGCNGLLYRYERGYDGLDSQEGAFGICTFWAIQNLALRGDIFQAEKLFDHAISYGNDLGLFSEEIDPVTGEALGNFPQAFTHVGLINAALTLEYAKKGAAA